MVGLPGWIPARVAAGAANGCGAAERSGRRRLLAGPLAVLGPQQQAPAGGPEGVDGEHAARLRATGDSPSRVQEDRASVVVVTTGDARSF